MTNRTVNIKQHAYKMGQRRCHCGRQLVWQRGQKNSASVEHLVPKSKGGTLARKNVLVVCHDCNMKRKTTCWVKWIKKNHPPKTEWLIKKYEDALQYYAEVDRPLKLKIKSPINVYIKNITINNA